MILTLRRTAKRDTYTIGKLSVNGVYECDTLEDKVRDLNKEAKVQGKTAIPNGSYLVRMDIQSPRFSKSKKYAKINGYLPRLVDVPYYEGVLIHIGNTAEDTDGCILVGKNKAVGQVLESTDTFWRLYEKLQYAHSAGETIIMEIKNDI